MSILEGFTPIIGIFFAVFHPHEGTKILHQVPEHVCNVENNVFGNVLYEDVNDKTVGLVDFNDIKNHVIPKPEFCNRLLAVKSGDYRIAGYPVNIREEFYARNSFNFNFCFIFDHKKDSTIYEPMIKRLGRMFKVLEEQLQILSKSSKDRVYFNMNNPNITDYISKRDLNNKYYSILDQFRKDESDKNGEFSINNVIQQLFQDLNSYSECSIRINAGNAIDVKLFPKMRLPDMTLVPCDVPISTVELSSLTDFYWDINLLRMIPHINGVNSIYKIARLCNADYTYTCECIKHLMTYKCIILLDTFSFQNIYSTTSKISTFIEHSLLGEECKDYIYNDSNPIKKMPYRVRNTSTASLDAQSVASEKVSSEKMSSEKLSGSYESNSFNNHSTGNYFDKSYYTLSTIQIFQLYLKFKPGVTVEKWYLENENLLRDLDLDLRRFVAYGLLQGILYRIYSYPMLTEYSSKWLTRCKVYYVETNEKLKKFDEKYYLTPLDEKYFSKLTEYKTTIFSKPGTSASIAPNSNKLSLQKFKTDKYIKFIKGESREVYSLLSILHLKKNYLDKSKHYDHICTEFDIGKREVEHVLKNFWKYRSVQN